MSAADPKTCARVTACLSAFVDEELGPRERRAVALHLARCEACRAERDTLVELGRLARAAPVAAPAAGLAARVRGTAVAPLARRVAAVALALLLLASALVGAYLLGRAHGAAAAHDRPAPRAERPDPAPEASDSGPPTRTGRGEQGLGGGPLLSPR